MMDKTHQYDLDQDAALYRPIYQTGRGYYVVGGIFLAVYLFSIYMYYAQIRNGLGVTGMNQPVTWGFYIVNFVFFIGISHAGTLISAILRVTHAGWRTPVTRMAEFITVVALSVGGLFPLIDMGRPERVLNLIKYGRWSSPITWDILAISTYLTGSLIYLLLPMIPDLAICRDKLGKQGGNFRRFLYRILSVGWRDTTAQKKNLFSGMGIMAILIIPIAVSVHTVVSFIFAMTLRAGWNSTVYGIYFVAGAIFSGIATIIIVMAILRKAFHLEEYITKSHFQKLGYMLGAFTVIMAYFNVLEFLVPGYKMIEGEEFLLQQILAGTYAPVYWAYILFGLIIPAIIVLVPRTRTIAWLVFASILINITMAMERFLIVVPAMRVPLMPYEPANYFPSWVEWSIIAGAVAGFALIISIFAKLFPVISIWEVREQHDEQHAHVAQEAGGGESVTAIPRIGRHT